jgi:hypothetical protein
MTRTFEVEFPEGYFGQWEEDTPSRGALDVRVRASDGRSYQLAFYDPACLKQVLEIEAAAGAVHYAEPNLVIVTLVDTATIRKAVAGLAADGYFDAIRAED